MHLLWFWIYFHVQTFFYLALFSHRLGNNATKMTPNLLCCSWLSSLILTEWNRSGCKAITACAYKQRACIVEEEVIKQRQHDRTWCDTDFRADSKMQWKCVPLPARLKRTLLHLVSVALLMFFLFLFFMCVPWRPFVWFILWAACNSTGRLCRKADVRMVFFKASEPAIGFLCTADLTLVQSLIECASKSRRA